MPFHMVGLTYVRNRGTTTPEWLTMPV